MTPLDCPVYTPDEAAVLLRVSKSTVVRACKAGELDAIKVQSTWRIPRAYLDSKLRLPDPED